MSWILIIPISALLLGFVLTLFVRSVAWRVGLLDHPDGERKLHADSIPLGGGLALFLATVITVVAAILGYHQLQATAAEDMWQLVGLLLASATICAVGLADDRLRLRGRQKLVGQLLAVGVLIGSGTVVNRLGIFGWEVDLGLLAIPFTVAWLLGAINAVNLIDGADGMATTIGIVVSTALAIMAGLCGHPLEAVVAAALAGALMGFLVFNFPPASIFLGDAGSMLIGLVLGALAIRGSLKGPATVALAAPAALMAIPFFDSLIAIVRRRLTGRSIYWTDRGHLHHCLLRKGLSGTNVLICVGLMCAATAAGALVSVYLQNELIAVISAVTVLGILVVCKVFGFSEFVLLTHKAISFGSSLVPTNKGSRQIQQHSVRIQGSRAWDELWETLTDFAEVHNLCAMRLDLNVAWLYEGYHASWQRAETSDAWELWEINIPVSAASKTFGRLCITGPANKESVHTLLALIAELVESLEPTLARLIQEHPSKLEDTKKDLTAGRRLHNQPNPAKTPSAVTTPT